MPATPTRPRGSARLLAVAAVAAVGLGLTAAALYLISPRPLLPDVPVLAAAAEAPVRPVAWQRVEVTYDPTAAAPAHFVVADAGVRITPAWDAGRPVGRPGVIAVVVAADSPAAETPAERAGRERLVSLLRPQLALR